MYRAQFRAFSQRRSVHTGIQYDATFARLRKNLEEVRKHVSRPLTLGEKLLYSHLADPSDAGSVERGSSYLKLRPDRVAMQDVTAQTALLQFMSAGLARVAAPSSIHCDHLVVAQDGAEADVGRAERDNAEVFRFLRSASRKYGIGFWGPGSGIIHQIVFENYAFPGGLMIGCDSHTVNAGGLGMLAVGVGGADATGVMAGDSWELKAPSYIGVHLTGAIGGWTASKDVILALAGQLSVSGGTGSIVEYYGDGLRSLSCTGMGTIANMGAEVGATTSVFPFSPQMAEYLRATGRADVAALAEQHETELLRADEGARYDRVVEIDLSTLEPHINGPFSPDAATPLSSFALAVREHNWPEKLEVGLIGSCTNSSYEDMQRAASIARQARDKGVAAKSLFYITPGSEQVRATVERDGLLDTFQTIGGKVLGSACGPCIGQWNRSDVEKDTDNSIITSYNRNFVKRADGNPNTRSFVASPELVTAMTLGGRLTFNPMEDELLDSEGHPWKLSPPSGDNLPREGFDAGRQFYEEPPADGSDVVVEIDPKSERIQLLEAFEPWDGKDLEEAPILLKVRGKCTTDHISAAGPWLQFRGHMDNISNNYLIGAINEENDRANKVRNVFTGEFDAVPTVARQYQRSGQKWVVVADANFGEGSAREHAALSARYLGGAAIIAKSFARIHETNLKKQGMLPLWFEDAADYDRIRPSDRISIRGLKDLDPNQTRVEITVHPQEGEPFKVALKHTLSADQIKWWKAGSMMNALVGK